MGLFSGFLALLTTVAVLVFALSNRQEVEVVLLPVYEPVNLPLYLVALGLMATGFTIGALLVWMNGGELRRERRLHKKRVKLLEKELSSITQTAQQQDMPDSDFFPALPKK